MFFNLEGKDNANREQKQIYLIMPRCSLSSLFKAKIMFPFDLQEKRYWIVNLSTPVSKSNHSSGQTFPLQWLDLTTWVERLVCLYVYKKLTCFFSIILITNYKSKDYQHFYIFIVLHLISKKLIFVSSLIFIAKHEWQQIHLHQRSQGE